MKNINICIQPFAVFIIFTIFCATLINNTNAGPRKRLFEMKCGRPCHSLNKSLGKKKSQGGWEMVVERMRKKKSSGFTEKEGKEIAAYLFEIRGSGGPIRKAKKTKKKEKPKVAVSKPAPKPKPTLIVEPESTGEHKAFQKLDTHQFIEPDVCAGCHSEIYDQWEGSMHSKSFTDPLWRGSLKMFAAEAKTEDEKLEIKMCIKCHAPLGFRSGAITSHNDDFDKAPEIVKEGIFCNWCHNISEARSIGNADYEVSPGQADGIPSAMLGPHKGAVSSFHPTKYSELHTRSEFCGLCHNVTHAANATPIESTFDEWKNSPYNTGDPATSVHCQDCHMRQTLKVAATGKTARPDVQGKACDNGPIRPHVATHYIVGGTTFTGEGYGNATHAKLATARLQNAADIEIIKSGEYKNNNMATVKVKVINSGAGHYLPTGMTEIRQMWIDFEIKDKNRNQIFRSGALNEKGGIDPEAIMYNTILGDKNGNPVVNLALADRVLVDKRIPPKGFSIEKYTFFIPKETEGPLQIKTTLRYRSCSQAFANQALKEKTQIVPVVDMTSANMKIAIK